MASEISASFGHQDPLTQRAALAILDLIDPVRRAVTGPGFSPIVIAPAPAPAPEPEHEPRMKKPAAADSDPFKVCIVGAGAAGLFTAMIFDHLKKAYGLKVDYEILEARPRKRLGGRLYTHTFEAKAGHPPIGPHDYYDVGAMRFPDSNIMKRVFKLFKLLDMVDPIEPNPPARGSLVPYYLQDPKQPSLYNGNKLVLGPKPATADAYKIPGIPDDHRGKSAGLLVSEAIEPFTKLFNADDPGPFWDKIEEEAEPYSVRQYQMQVAKYHYNTVQFLETVSYGDGWYNQGLTDHIMEDIIFGGNNKWWCVEGGSSQIAERMFGKIKQSSHIYFGRVVTKMGYVHHDEQIRVHFKGEDGTITKKNYDAVFNSAPLGAMQRMQLNGLKLNWQTKSAIRSLGYGASVKIGVRFKNLWWIKHFGITQGGAGRTDLPIRQCVYPSYNIHDDPDKPGVLLVSYCWGQEASRLGALIDRQSPKGEDELKEVLIHDLARLHVSNKTHDEFERVRQIIADSYLDHFAHDWVTDPFSAGAFAYFGPGQFKHMYQGITSNDGKHIIIGEAASAYHGWVAGALDSAVRGVFQFLVQHLDNEAARNAVIAYGNDDVAAPFGPLPAEYVHIPFMDAHLKPVMGDDGKDKERKDNKERKGKAVVPMYPAGALAMLQVEMEKMRLAQGTEELDLNRGMDDAELKLGLNHFQDILFKGVA